MLLINILWVDLFIFREILNVLLPPLGGESIIFSGCLYIHSSVCVWGVWMGVCVWMWMGGWVVVCSVCVCLCLSKMFLSVICQERVADYL